MDDVLDWKVQGTEQITNIFIDGLYVQVRLEVWVEFVPIGDQSTGFPEGTSAYGETSVSDQRRWKVTSLNFKALFVPNWPARARSDGRSAVKLWSSSFGVSLIYRCIISIDIQKWPEYTLNQIIYIEREEGRPEKGNLEDARIDRLGLGGLAFKNLIIKKKKLENVVT